MPTTITIQAATVHEIARRAVEYRTPDTSQATINEFVNRYPDHVNTQLATMYATSTASAHWDGETGEYTVTYPEDDSPDERADSERSLRNDACMFGIYIPGSREGGSRSILEAAIYMSQIKVIPVADYDLPELTGSPKQIAWAKDLRTRLIADVHEALTDGFRDNGDDPIKVECVTAALRQVLTRFTQAKWWIDAGGYSASNVFTLGMIEARRRRGSGGETGGR